MHAQRTGWILATLLAAAAGAAGETFVVPDDYGTIQEAIDAAADGDRIRVEPDFYFENLDFLGKEIVLESCEGPERTIIDGSTLTRGEDYGSVVSFTNGETPATRLDGFTLAGGIGTAGLSSAGASVRYGGGVYCDNGSPTLARNIIRDNEAHGVYSTTSVTIEGCTIENNRGAFGGGVSVEADPAAEVVLVDCRLLANRADYGGGGVDIYGAALRLDGCTFEENEAGLGGGGLYVNSDQLARIESCNFLGNSGGFAAGGLGLSAPAKLRSCRIAVNSAPVGAGVYIENSSDVLLDRCVIDGNVAGVQSGGVAVGNSVGAARLRHCTFAGNAAPEAGAIGSLRMLTTSAAELVNCILWGNGDAPVQTEDFAAGIAYSDVEGGFDGEGNIADDPLFIDAENGDFRLQAGSPSIDAGDPRSPVDPDGTVADMGAFFHRQFGFLRGDADGNGSVFALVDALALLLWQFGDGVEPPCLDAADSDDSGAVNVLVDALHLLAWSFAAGPPPAAPGPLDCGLDPTADDTACAAMLACEE